MSSQPRMQRAVPWGIFLVFGLLAIGMGVVGYVFYVRQQMATRTEKAEELSAIGDLKVEEIVNWIAERSAHARLIRDDRARANSLREALRNPSDRSTRQEILEWMRLFRDDFHYAAILLVDTSLRVVQSSPEAVASFNPRLAALVREALKSRKEIFSDLYRDEATKYVHLDLVVPLFAAKDVASREEPAGAVVLRIDPEQSLYPIVQSWPTTSQTSEALLVRREGDEVVFLNELRHRKHTALALRFPVTEEHLPEGMAVRGQIGVVTGLDYRHVPVLAVICQIPGSGWFLVTKTDINEVEAPARERGWMIALIVGLLILTAVSVAVTLWWNERATYFRKRYELELEREALIQHFQYLTKYANDIILLKDSGGNIIEANDRALADYGYSRSELMGLNIRELRAPGFASSVADDMKHIQESNGLVFETVHRRKDGTTFPVEVSSRSITVDGVSFYQSIVRDVTERKQAESRVLSNNRLYSMVSNINRAIVRVQDEQALCDEACRAAVENGKFMIALIGVVDPQVVSVKIAASRGTANEDDMKRYVLAEKASGESTPVEMACRQGRSVVNNNVADSEQSIRWGAEALRHGIRSAGAFPLKISSGMYGAFALYSNEVSFFDEEKIRLLEDMAEDLSYAIEFMQKRSKKST